MDTSDFPHCLSVRFGSSHAKSAACNQVYMHASFEAFHAIKFKSMPSLKVAFRFYSATEWRPTTQQARALRYAVYAHSRRAQRTQDCGGSRARTRRARIEPHHPIRDALAAADLLSVSSAVLFFTAPHRAGPASDRQRLRSACCSSRADQPPSFAHCPGGPVPVPPSQNRVRVTVTQPSESDLQAAGQAAAPVTARLGIRVSCDSRDPRDSDSDTISEPT